MRHLFPIAFVCALATPAGATDYTVEHNGQAMHAEIDGAGRIAIRYLSPRPSLYELGVMPGALAFEGRLNGRFARGVAYVFSKTCRPAPYEVRGAIDEAGNLLLVGAAPVRRAGSCAVTEYSRTSRNAALAFSGFPQPEPPAVVVPPADPRAPAPGQLVDGCNPMDAACLNSRRQARDQARQQPAKDTEPPKPAAVGLPPLPQAAEQRPVPKAEGTTPPAEIATSPAFVGITPPPKTFDDQTVTHVPPPTPAPEQQKATETPKAKPTTPTAPPSDL